MNHPLTGIDIQKALPFLKKMRKLIPKRGEDQGETELTSIHTANDLFSVNNDKTTDDAVGDGYKLMQNSQDEERKTLEFN